MLLKITKSGLFAKDCRTIVNLVEGDIIEADDSYSVALLEANYAIKHEKMLKEAPENKMRKFDNLEVKEGTESIETVETEEAKPFSKKKK